jgi:hypothetical protein
MKTMQKIFYKYFGAIFFWSLYIINVIIKLSPDIDKFLIFMTIICLIIPILKKENSKRV